MRAFVAWLLTAIVWLVLCHSSGAGIDETLDQALKRYGRCLKTLTAPNGKVYQLLNKNGFKRLFIHFYDGRSRRN